MAKDKKTDEELAELIKTELPPVQLPPTVAAATKAEVLAKVATTLRQEDGKNSTGSSGEAKS